MTATHPPQRGHNDLLERALQALAGMPHQSAALRRAAPRNLEIPLENVPTDLQLDTFLVDTVFSYMRQQHVGAIEALDRLTRWLQWGNVRPDSKRPDGAILEPYPGLSQDLQDTALLIIDTVMGASGVENPAAHNLLGH